MGRRDLKFTELSQAIEEVKKLKEKGYTKEGTWSLGQICDHLNKTMYSMIHGADFKLPLAFLMKPLMRWMMLKSVLQCVPSKIKAPAPKPLIPSENLDEDAAIAEFEKIANQIISPDIPLIENHPVFGKITREENVKVQSWHAAHHLSYLIPNE